MTSFRFGRVQRFVPDRLETNHYRFDDDGDDLADEERIIQGQVARSKEEYYVAKALYKLGYEFIYQYNMRSGGTQRGDIIIDFLVQTFPGWTPLEVQSLRYHTGKFASREGWRIAMIEKRFKTKVAMVWDYELEDETDAVRVVKDVLG